MTIRMGWMAALFGVVCGSAWASEPGCYRTEDAAAAQVGVRGVEGFRLEGVRTDVFSGAHWATVSSCQHPERPGVLVLTSLAAPRGVGSGGAVPVARAMVMVAGSRVRLVMTEAMARMDVSAVAQTSGAVGDRVRVRLAAVSRDGSSDGLESWGSAERFAVGVVKSSTLVEMEAK